MGTRLTNDEVRLSCAAQDKLRQPRAGESKGLLVVEARLTNRPRTRLVLDTYPRRSPALHLSIGVSACTLVRCPTVWDNASSCELLRGKGAPTIGVATDAGGVFV